MWQARCARARTSTAGGAARSARPTTPRPAPPAASTSVRWAVAALAGYDDPRRRLGRPLGAAPRPAGPDRRCCSPPRSTAAARTPPRCSRSSAPAPTGEEEIGGMGRHVTGALLGVRARGRVGDGGAPAARRPAPGRAAPGDPRGRRRGPPRGVRPPAATRSSSTTSCASAPPPAPSARGWARPPATRGACRSGSSAWSRCRADPAATDGTPEDAYLALVATAWDDAHRALAARRRPARRRRRRAAPRRRPPARPAAARRGRRAARPRRSPTPTCASPPAPSTASPAHEHAPADTFERLERLRRHRRPGPAARSEPPRSPASCCAAAATAPPTSLRHLGAMDPAARAAVAGRLHGRPAPRPRSADRPARRRRARTSARRR